MINPSLIYSIIDNRPLTDMLSYALLISDWVDKYKKGHVRVKLSGVNGESVCLWNFRQFFGVNAEKNREMIMTEVVNWRSRYFLSYRYQQVSILIYSRRHRDHCLRRCCWEILKGPRHQTSCRLRCQGLLGIFWIVWECSRWTGPYYKNLYTYHN